MAWRTFTRDGLAAAGAELPQCGGCHAGRGERCGAGDTDTERSRQDRVGVTDELERRPSEDQPAVGKIVLKRRRALRSCPTIMLLYLSADHISDLSNGNRPRGVALRG